MGCSAPATAPALKHTKPAASEVTFVAASDTTLKFVSTTPTGIAVTRTVTLPAEVAALAWVGPEPVVMVGRDRVGHITAKGFEPYPAVPAAKWIVPQPQPYSPPLDPPLVQLIVDADGVVWQARCDWGEGRLKNDELSCDAWVYARLTGMMTIARTAPKLPPERPLPTIEPSTAIKAELVGDKPILRCTSGTTTIEYPPVDQREDVGRWGFLSVGDLEWITTTPPMFRVTLQLESRGFDVLFAGCEEAPDFTEAKIASGPDDVIVIYGNSKASVRRHGTEIGTLEHATFVSFAPAP